MEHEGDEGMTTTKRAPFLPCLQLLMSFLAPTSVSLSGIGSSQALCIFWFSNPKHYTLMNFLNEAQWILLENAAVTWPNDNIPDNGILLPNMIDLSILT